MPKIVIFKNRQWLTVYSNDQVPLIGDIIALKKNSITKYQVTSRAWAIEGSEVRVVDNEPEYLDGELEYVQLDVIEL
jgi:hypothetical protein